MILINYKSGITQQTQLPMGERSVGVTALCWEYKWGFNSWKQVEAPEAYLGNK